MNVLIVDDDFVDRESVKRSLKNISGSIEIKEATSVEEAESYCHSMEMDVVLLDYSMPRQNGIELLKSVSKEKGLSENLIIMMSHSEDEQLALDCIEAGAEDFLLKKEISESRLRRTIFQAKRRFKLESELRDSFSELKKLAERDTLTGLANRFLFEESFKIALANNRRTESQLSLMLFDIDDFKLINDNYGHLVGDQLLVKLASRIRSCLRGNELFARLGGDEFAIVLTNQVGFYSSSTVAERLKNVLLLPFKIDGNEIRVTISIGIVVTDDHQSQPADMLKQADIAMYRSKRLGRGKISFFKSEMQDSVEKQLRIESGLELALRNHEFHLNFQPIIDTDSMAVAGFESLLRWESSNGPVSPVEFIPAAERGHKMFGIGRWVIQETLKQYASWQFPRDEPPSISINLSATQLADEKLIQFIKEQCDRNNISPTRLEFELTETALIEQPDLNNRFLHQLKDLGCRIALDDFGTGYSSVLHLKHFPIDVVKLDRQILPLDPECEKDSLLFIALANMISTLGLNTVAEGVETAAQGRFCKDLGIDRLQGYYFSKPIAAQELSALIKNNPGAEVLSGSLHL